ncbi:hypothetical protein RND71_011658 [Anisodus tanguticus]|uniref:50S ribosomal protein L23, chloroplastic n=1 Tax=Anisodus tanguticus TaxID=243964 RepID=A0AAE1SFB9_9SOLA|nr:hypothetical protein RND71_011658 [Anisodus tanguticus]
MAAAIASPAAALVCSSRARIKLSRHQSQGPRFLSPLFPFKSRLLLQSSALFSEMLTSFSARGSQFPPRFLRPVSCEVGHHKEGDAKKQRLEYAIKVKTDESTNRHVLDIQSSDSSGRKKIMRMERNPKCLNNNASQRNKIEYYQVIQYPLKTESTMGNILRHNTLVFVVHKDADKKIIRDAVKKLFKIEMKKINISIMPDGTKKAYVVLTPNHSCNRCGKKNQSHLNIDSPSSFALYANLAVI